MCSTNQEQSSGSWSDIMTRPSKKWLFFLPATATEGSRPDFQLSLQQNRQQTRQTTSQPLNPLTMWSFMQRSGPCPHASHTAVIHLGSGSAHFKCPAICAQNEISRVSPPPHPAIIILALIPPMVAWAFNGSNVQLSYLFIYLFLPQRAIKGDTEAQTDRKHTYYKEADRHRHLSSLTLTHFSIMCQWWMNVSRNESLIEVNWPING